MKIGLLGGTFDPPHILHERIAGKAKKVLRLDKTILIPTYETKYYGEESAKNPTRPDLRLAMAQKIPGVEVWDLDIRHKLDGQTRHTIAHLEPGPEYVWIMGSDQDITRWLDYEKLLDFMEFYVVPRYPTHKFPVKLVHPRMHALCDEPLVDFEIDSSAIREHLRSGRGVGEIVEPSGKPLRELMHPRVLEYVLENNVYNEGNQYGKEIR